MGLGIAEYNALTPLELRAELEACAEIKDAERDRFKFQNRLIDNHFAILETLVYNAHFKNPAKVSDFKLIEEKKAVISAEVLNFDIAMRAQAQENLRKKGKIWG